MSTLANVKPTAIYPNAADTDDNQLFKRIAWRLMPILFIGYLINYLDRTNVGYAQLQMREALAFGDSVFGFGAVAFFVGYMLFEIPSNILLARIGIRKTMLRIMLLWGLASMATALVKTPEQFYTARFLVGVFEAGFAPGVLYYLTLWFPADRRARANALFLMGFAVAPILAGPIAGLVMTHLHNWVELQGWQWLFVIEGIPALLLGLACWLWLVDTPDQARWLTPQQRQRVALLLRQDAPVYRPAARWFDGLIHVRAWGLGLVAFLLVCSIYAMTFWQPTLLKGMGLSLMQVGMAAVLPASCGVVAALWLGARSDRRRERPWHFTLAAVSGACGLALTSVFPENVVGTIAGLTLATAGLSAAMTILWATPGEILPRTSLAAAIALITTLNSFSGVVAPLMVAKVKEATGGFALSFQILAVGVLVAALVFHSVLRNTSKGQP